LPSKEEFERFINGWKLTKHPITLIEVSARMKSGLTPVLERICNSDDPNNPDYNPNLTLKSPKSNGMQRSSSPYDVIIISED